MKPTTLTKKIGEIMFLHLRYKTKVFNTIILSLFIFFLFVQ